MQSTPFAFDLLKTDTETMARRGRLHTTRGTVETPVFMPVGTQATVKTLTPDEVVSTGAEIILANTYHLMLRPGADLIEEAGGVQRFMAWDRPLLTDSGGFQVFSLASQTKVTEEGVRFRAHTDGSYHELTPERAVELQLKYGSDIMMPLDQLIGLPAPQAKIRAAADRTHRWLDRAIAAHKEQDGAARGSALFGICQGGTDREVRLESAAYIAQADVAGCAVGGLSVGEPKPIMNEILEVTTPILPANKPRYLMGVGSPEDLWNGVARGIDMFDCVLPTRLARNAALFTPTGRINIRSTKHKHRHEPVDETCDCLLCTTFTAAYLHHLFRAEEILGLRLASLHNLRFLARQMETMRAALEAGRFAQAMAEFMAEYRPVGHQAPAATI